MQSNSNRICYTCGKSYRYCSHCPEDSKKPFWMNAMCSEQCHDIFAACVQFNLGRCSKDEVREVLMQYDSKNTHYASESINQTVAKIFDEDDMAAPDEKVEALPDTPDEATDAVANAPKKKRRRAVNATDTEEETAATIIMVGE